MALGRNRREKWRALIQKDLDATTSSATRFNLSKSLNFSDFRLPHLQNEINRCVFMGNSKNNACKLYITALDSSQKVALVILYV